jgi:predicted dehydrogenase
MSKIRLGMIGAGQIAGITGREFQRHPDCEIVAVADANHERADALASQLGVSKTYATVAPLVEHVDAVYVAVPNAYHEEIACAALKAGNHVLLEKPFALDLESAQRMVATAESADRTLMLGMNQRFERNVQRARQLCQQGRFGEIYHIKAYWRRRAGIPRLGSWFTDKSIAGGGALLDIGVHVLDAALHLLDNFRPTSVSGATFSRFGPRGLGEGGWGASEREFDGFDVDDFATALIRLEGGAVITLEAAWALHQHQGNDHDIVIYGEDAGMAVFADQLFEPGDNGEYRIVQNAATPPITFPHCSRAHHFINVLMGSESAMIETSESLAVQSILDGIYRSANSHSEVLL